MLRPRDLKFVDDLRDPAAQKQVLREIEEKGHDGMGGTALHILVRLLKSQLFPTEASKTAGQRAGFSPLH